MQLPNLAEFVERARSLSARFTSKPKATPPGLRSPPQLGGGLPLVGHTVEFIRAPIELLFRAQREMGEMAAFRVANRSMVALFGPEAHQAVFRAPDAQLSPSEAYKIMTPVFGKGLVYDATPEKMAEQLKMLLPALKDRRMRTYGEAVVHETEATIANWGEMGVVDFVDFCRVLTNFTSSRCLLGKEFREGMTEEFAAVYHDLERGVAPIAYVNAHLPIPSFRKRDKARVRMVEMITGIVADRRENQREGEDFLQTLMESRYADGRALTENEITGMLLAAMFAGHHTSSVTTAWTLLELLQNPETLRRTVEEIDHVFGKKADGSQLEVSHMALRELTYTENVVKEALRLHPPLFLLVRVAKQDFIYKDVLIPEGTWIVVSPTVSHQIASVFAEPAKFDPDRFAPPREEDKQDFAFIAFGGGRHKCLGNAFAILQIKAILALLLGQYEFELMGDPVVGDFQGLVVGPKEPCRIRYRRRAQPSVSGRAEIELSKVATQKPPATDTPPPSCPAHVNGNANGDVTANRNGNVNSEPQPAGVCPVPHGAAATTQKPAAKTKRLLITLDTDVCQGHAVCAGEAPEVFRLGADEKVELLDPAFADALPPELHAKVRAAASYCPTRAIRLRNA